ncbi:uncharacterized protein F5891DRAFT_83267 [Suillus fuscotomentosus]|uniref:Uncharacterized protein n=1 Tax=Suillus fuscotomentosus TaxID=1912939 RepID=A0AAD4ECH5_9AGAM|nr:uncharacterized protein F5891DRAFT_83267 [Suillus fuscotomentosus]KAG1903714.1 hypothetical protein F5891DRAFT_83267 [Suillus fuscotomentosus]
MPFNTLPYHISSQFPKPFEKNSRRHLLEIDLEIRMRNMMKLLPNSPGVLPPPSTTIRNAWNLKPNKKVGTIPPQARGDVMFRRTPPTTMDASFTVVNDTSSLIHGTYTPTPHTCMDDVSSSKVAGRYQPKTEGKFSLKTNSPKQNALSPNDQHYPANTENSRVTQSGKSSIYAEGFRKIVEAKMAELRVHGLDFVVESLLTDGAQHVDSALLVSMVVQTMLIKLTKESPKQIKGLERILRVRAMNMFRLHWKSDGHWKNICSTSGQYSALTLKGVNKAGLLGSLFSANIVTADDIAICLFMLLEDIHFDRLCAIHALLLYADNRLCDPQNLPVLLKLKEKLRVVDPLTNLCLRGPVPHSQALVQKIFDIIEGWMINIVHAYKREQGRIFAGSYPTWKPPSNAMGPRLRRMRNEA